MADVLLETMVNPNFKVSELIATGGMASIYKGVQLSLERPVAIKRLHPHLTNNLDFVARFEKEAKSVAQLRHENIVSIIDFGRDDEGYYLVLEFVEGKNLKELLKAEKKLPAEIGLVIAEQVAQGLRFAHSARMVHRDIKPANIMLSKAGGVKITDFGIAKFTFDVSITATGSMIGSPAYMSPEHVRGTDLDSRADIFSLGVVLYEILTGEKPFQGENYQEVIAKILTEHPKPILQLAPELSLGWAEIIHKCLDKDKLKRYQNCEDILLDLRKQFDFYQIQKPIQLIREYLANPTGISSRLVHDRVQRHLDWGLHYFNQGTDQSEAATKEFLEVLRWDKENQTAQKYLAKLEKIKKKFRAKTITSKLRRRKSLPWFLVPVGLLLAVILGFLAGGYFEKAQRTDSATLTLDAEKIGFTSEKNPGSDVRNQGNVQLPLAPLIPGTGNPGKDNRSATVKSNIIFLFNPENQKERARNAGKVSPEKLQASIQFGRLVVSAKPKASVEINGKVYGTVPPALTIKAEEGKYRVNLKQKGYETQSKKIWVQKDKTIVIEESLKEEKNNTSKKYSPIEP